MWNAIFVALKFKMLFAPVRELLQRKKNYKMKFIKEVMTKFFSFLSEVLNVQNTAAMQE
jgi:hypothetical protein